MALQNGNSQVDGLGMNDYIAKRPWLPYVAPMAIYLLFLQAQTSWPQLLEFWYPAKTIAVAAVLWFFRKQFEELCSPMICRASAPLAAGAKPTAAGKAPALQGWMLASVIGLVVTVIWIAIDPYYPKLGTAKPFDPSGRWVFIGFRVVGAVLVVPLMEELFWRAFLIRWLVNEDFKKVAIGTYTGASFAITVALFGLEHAQWLAGLICGTLYNWLYYHRRDIGACVVAHAVSNAALAAWVLTTGDWNFW